MKSIAFRCDRQHPSSGIANSLSLTIGQGGIHFEGGELTVPLSTLDQAITETLGRTLPLTTGEADSTQVEPERIDRFIRLEPSDRLELLKLRATMLDASMGVSQQEKESIYQAFLDSCRLMRDFIVAEAAEQDCQPPTLVYGARLPKATTISPDTRPRQCHTLIHATNPENPEDLHLRELNIQCDRIIRYRVEEMDDAAWERQNQPLRWPLTPLDFRELAYARITAMLC